LYSQFLSLLLQERPQLLFAEVSCLIQILNAGDFTRDTCALALALSLFEASGWDECLFRFAFIKYLNGAHVRDTFADARNPNPGLLAFFREWSDHGSRLLYELVLNFLDRTESHMDFRGDPRHHWHCRKMWQLALLGADGERLEIYVRETAAQMAVRNFLFAHFRVALADVHIDAEAPNRIRFRVACQPSGHLFMALSGTLDPQHFYDRLASSGLAPVCYQVLKRLPPVVFGALPLDLSDYQLLHILQIAFFDAIADPAAVLRCAPLRRRPLAIGARFLQCCFDFLLEHPEWAAAHSDVLYRTLQDKHSEPPAARLSLALYGVLPVRDDQPFLLRVFDNLTIDANPTFQLILRGRGFSAEFVAAVLHNAGCCNTAAQFCERVFSTSVANHAAFSALCVRKLSVWPADSAVACEALAFAARAAVDAAPDMVSRAILSNSHGFRRAVFRLLFVPVNTRAVDAPLLALLTDHPPGLPAPREFASAMGLVNPECLCYMNSVLLQLSANAAIYAEFLDQMDLPPDFVAFRQLFAQLRECVSTAMRPSGFWKAYAWTHSDFVANCQDDAVEFFGGLIDRALPRIAGLFKGRQECVFEVLVGEWLNSLEKRFMSL
jgi:hypothetical protein